MSRVIYKWSVPVDDNVHFFELNPTDAVVHVDSLSGDTRDGVQMWVEYDRSTPHRSMRHFRVVGTGQPIEGNERYIGTAHCPPFVWHIVEVIS